MTEDNSAINKEIVELFKYFVNEYSEDKDIPKEDIMKFLGNVGRLLIPICNHNYLTNTSDIGINDELKNKVLGILFSNGYQSINEEDEFIIDIIQKTYDGFIVCRVRNMGINIKKEDMENGILDVSELLADYIISNFLNHLNKSILSSVYYDFSNEYFKNNRYVKHK